MTIGAVQSASPSLSANLTVQLVSEVPTPSIASVSVTQHSDQIRFTPIGGDQITFTITGSNFIPGASARIHPQGPGILCCSDLFGGTLTAENRREGGAVFRLTLPVAGRLSPA